MRYIEFSAALVDRSGEIASSQSIGYMRWNADDLASGPEIVNPFDAKVVAMLKAFVKKHDDELAALSSQLEGK